MFFFKLCYKRRNIPILTIFHPDNENVNESENRLMMSIALGRAQNW